MPFWFDQLPQSKDRQISDVVVELLTWTAKKTRKAPQDQLEDRAPCLLRARFLGIDNLADPHAAIDVDRAKPVQRKMGEIPSYRID